MTKKSELEILSAKKTSIERQFDDLKAQREQTQLALNNLDQELFRLQGAHRVIEELIKELTEA